MMRRVASTVQWAVRHQVRACSSSGLNNAREDLMKERAALEAKGTTSGLEYASCLHQLGNAELSLQNYQAVIDHMGKALAAYEAAHGRADNKLFGAALNTTALAHLNKGDLREGLTFARRASEMYDRLDIDPDEHVRVLMNYAAAQEMNREASALQTYKRVLQMLETLTGQQQAIDHVKKRITNLESQIKEIVARETEEAATKLDTLQGEHDGKDHIDVAKQLYETGLAHCKMTDEAEHLQSGMTYFERAFDMYERLGETGELYRDCQFALAMTECRRGDYSASVAFTTKGAEVTHGVAGDDVKVAKSLNEYGVLFSRRGENHAAIAHCKAAQEMYERLGMITESNAALFALAQNEAAIDKVEVALVHYKLSVAKCGEAGELTPELAQNLTMLFDSTAAAAEKLQKYECARGYLELSLEMHQVTEGSRLPLVATLFRLAEVHGRLGDKGAALGNFQSLLKLMEDQLHQVEKGELDDVRLGVARALLSHGMDLLAEKDFDAARECLELSSSAGAHLICGTFGGTLAVALASLEEFTNNMGAAVKRYKEGLGLLVDGEPTLATRLGGDLVTKGGDLVQAERFEVAREYLEVAMWVFDKLGDVDTARHRVAALLLLGGLEAEASSATPHFAQAITTAETVEDDAYLASALNSAGIKLSKLSPNDARVYLQRAKDLYEATGVDKANARYVECLECLSRLA